MKVDIEHHGITLPDQRNYDSTYSLAFSMAAEKLNSLDRMVEQCENSDSICRLSASMQEIQIRYLGQNYIVSFPDIDVSPINNHEKVELRDKILILDYLTRAKGTPLSGLLITYQELHEGSAYYPSFVNRVIKPLKDYFGNCPERLYNIAGEFDGLKANYGDAAITIPAFKRVPLTYLIWKGDVEFPPDANVLFDSTIQDYLSVEDIVVLCQTITWRLIRSLQVYSGILSK